MEDLDLAEILAPESDFIPETIPEVAELTGIDESIDQADGISSTATPTDRVDYHALVESIGGPEVIEALTPLLQESDDPISVLRELIPPESMESLIWAALDSPESQ